MEQREVADPQEEVAHVGVKVCYHCGEEKDSSSFHRRKTSKDGLRRECMSCAQEMYQEWIQANRPSVKRKQMLKDSKKRAKKFGILNNLELQDIGEPSHCPVLGIQLNWYNTGKAQDDSPSLDRIIPELGYTKGNIIVMSMKANRIKNDATSDELYKVANWLASKGS